MSFAAILLIAYGVLGLTILLSRLKDYDGTLNQGHPPDREIQVNFWTKKPTKVSKKATDK